MYIEHLLLKMNKTQTHFFQPFHNLLYYLFKVSYVVKTEGNTICLNRGENNKLNLITRVIKKTPFFLLFKLLFIKVSLIIAIKFP